MFESEVSIQICASATKTAFFAAKSQLGIKDLLCPPALSPMVLQEWTRFITGCLFCGCRKKRHCLKEKQRTPQGGAEPLGSAGVSSEHLPAPGQRQAAQGGMAKCDSFQDGVSAARGQGHPLCHIPMGMVKDLAPAGLSCLHGTAGGWPSHPRLRR